MVKLKNDKGNFIRAVQQLVKSYNIKVTNDSVLDFFISHPDYPSVKTVCDAFEHWQVEYCALNLKIEQLAALESPFLVYVSSDGGSLYTIYKVTNNKVIYFNAKGIKKKMPLDVFKTIWNGIAILIEPNIESGEKGYQHKKRVSRIKSRIFPFLIIGWVVVFIVQALGRTTMLNINWTWSLLLGTSFLGLFLSYLLVQVSFGYGNALTQKVCSLGQANSNGCYDVLRDKSSKIYGWIGWADVGLVYFMVNALFLVGSVKNPTYNVLPIVSLLSLPYIIFSVYYQAIVVKKWCILCLSVQMVLIVQIILLLPYLSLYDFNFINTLGYLKYFFIVSSLWLYYLDWTNTKESEVNTRTRYLRFKRDPQIFKHVIKNGKPPIDISYFQETLLLGNSEATVTIIAFLSLKCPPCEKMWRQLKNQLNKNDIRLYLVFPATKEETLKKIIRALYYYQLKQQKQPIVEVLNDWYEHKTFDEKKHIKNNSTILYSSEVERHIEHSADLFLKLDIKYTPSVYIQGYALPKQYSLEETIGFKDFLISTDINKKTISV